MTGCLVHARNYTPRAARLCALGLRAHARWIRRESAYLAGSWMDGLESRRLRSQAAGLQQQLTAALRAEEVLGVPRELSVIGGGAHV